MSQRCCHCCAVRVFAPVFELLPLLLLLPLLAAAFVFFLVL